MITDGIDIPAVTVHEEKAGFSAQTIGYPETYELPQLGDDSRVRHERAVVLVIDDGNRIKRRKSGAGYIHETMTPDGWTVQTEFETLSDVLNSSIYLNWKRINSGEESSNICADSPE